MKKAFLAILLVTLCLSACTSNEIMETPGPTDEDNWEITEGWGYREKNKEGVIANYVGNKKRISVPDGIDYVYLISSCVEEIHFPAKAKGFYLYNARSPGSEHLPSPNLKKITVSKGNPYLKVKNGVLYKRGILTAIWCYPYAKSDKRYVIPRNVFGNDVIPGGKYTEEVVIHPAFKIMPNGRRFSCPKNLKAVTISAMNPFHSSIDGVLFSKSKTKLLLYPPGKTDVTYTVPPSVTYISDFALSPFWNGSEYSHPYLKTIILPPSITYFADFSTDMYDKEMSPLEVLQENNMNFTFVVKKDSVTHETLEPFDLNIEFAEP